MSSLNKQQKRAKRAKTKAKQHRVARNTGATQASDSSVFDPQVFPYFDDSLLDTTPLTENELLDELFGTEDEALFEEFNTAFDLADEELAKTLAEEDDEDIERYLKKPE